MNGFLKVLKEFEGIIGAVLGVVATLITTKLLENMGKLNFYIKNWNAQVKKFEGNHFIYIKAETLDVKEIFINCNVEIYNSSEVPKVLRSIAIEFYNEKEEIFSIIPYDEDNKSKDILGSHPQEANVINIEPKKCIIKEFDFSINDKLILNKLKKTTAIYLIYTDEKNKQKRVLLRKTIL